MSRKYKFHKPEAAYFISFATVKWVKVFTDEVYFKILADSVTYCRKNKGMELYAYCFMPDHVHMIFRSMNGDPSGLLRDFKGYTSKELIKAIKNHETERRKNHFLKVFLSAGEKRSNVVKYQFWQQDNQQIELFSPAIVQQKLNYIHMNPVAAGLVSDPLDWKYSSARNYNGDQRVLEVDVMGSKI
ncbi:MAG: transposase [Bacteroidetes bacterium]|nr:transposase [Bacteroidota bacterium]